MAATQEWAETLRAVFPNEFERIVRAIHVHPEQADILRLFLDLAARVDAADKLAPTNKKRKLGDDETTLPRRTTAPAAAGELSEAVVAFECNDVSFQAPARKKLKLQVVRDAREPRRQQIRLLQPQSGQIEYALSIDDVDQIFCLPVPEKQQRQWNFCVFPRPERVSAEDTPIEQIVFTVNETAPTAVTVPSETPVEGDTYATVTTTALNQALCTWSKHVVRPDPDQFASSIPQPHRKGEKAYHVKAHRGSKEGYLFFLENGITFGFKKPLAFFPFSSIVSISYTSVLQRTFNLVITTMSMRDGEEIEQDVEFGMLDQADFAGIDEYIKKHELNDASMAATRRAKEYGVNKEKRGADHAAGASNGDVEDEQSELQKAEQLLQDEEDELEEDYEASGGESDGSGEDSDEEDDGGDGADDEHAVNGDEE